MVPGGFPVEGSGVHLALFQGAELCPLHFETEGKFPDAPFREARITGSGRLTRSSVITTEGAKRHSLHTLGTLNRWRLAKTATGASSSRLSGRTVLFNASR